MCDNMLFESLIGGRLAAVWITGAASRYDIGTDSGANDFYLVRLEGVDQTPPRTETQQRWRDVLHPPAVVLSPSATIVLNSSG